MTTEPYAFAFMKGSDDLAAPINEILNKMLSGSTSIGMEYGPRAEAGLLTSQRVIEEMFQDIIINGTSVEEAAQAAEDQLNELFETVG